MQRKFGTMPKRKSLPNFSSYDEASEWLDTHSTADLYAKPVKFTVAPNLKVTIVDSYNNPVETILLKRQMSRKIRQIAKYNNISSKQLVQRWLREKIQEQLRLSA
ncbi:MAG: hypothetical protein ACRENG_25395 [bacterium]